MTNTQSENYEGIVKKLPIYRIDYLIYIISVIVLDCIALYYPHTYIPLIAIMLAWVSLAWQAIKELKNGHIGTEFFLVFATLVALVAKQEQAIMLVLLIMLIARYIELIIEKRTSQALEKLIHLIPSDVTVLQHNEEVIIPLHQVKPGMEVVVKTGGLVPTDGFVTQGTAWVNESALTGESLPQEKQKSDHVFAGSFIESGSILFQVTHVKNETLFGKMTALLAQADARKAGITVLTEKIVYVAAPLILIFIVFVWFFTGNIDIVITLLIFGSPLELSLVTPLTVLSGTVAAFKNGILVKGGRALERLAHVDTMVFDKTGTLTLGQPVVVDIQTADAQYSTDAILKLAAIAECRADHVVAKAILKKAHEQNIHIPQPQEYISLVGHGVQIVFDHKTYFLGNRHFIQAPEHGNSSIPDKFLTDSSQVYSDFYLATGGAVIGKIRVSDAIRPDAKTTIQHLKDSGITDIMLMSGDTQQITQMIAHELGITKAFGGIFPDEKLKMLNDLQKKGKIVAMVGDGINDVAALKQADVGIAMGAMGMEPAIEAADLVLMTNELKKVFFVRSLSQQVFRVIAQNLLIGFLLLHALGIILTLMHIISPIYAAFFHAISDVVILLNASRLINFKVPKNKK